MKARQCCFVLFHYCSWRKDKIFTGLLQSAEMFLRWSGFVIFLTLYDLYACSLLRASGGKLLYYAPCFSVLGAELGLISWCVFSGSLPLCFMLVLVCVLLQLVLMRRILKWVFSDNSDLCPLNVNYWYLPPSKMCTYMI